MSAVLDGHGRYKSGQKEFASMKLSKNEMEYKGYIGQFTYDEDLDIFEGNITNIKELVLFQGKSMDSLRSDFQDAINDYIDWYKKRGKEPDNPFPLP